MRTENRWSQKVFPDRFFSGVLCFLILFLLVGIQASKADDIISIEAANTAIVDSEKPVIDIDSLQVDKSEATIGDVVLVTVRITDNESLSRVVISFDNRDSGKMIIFQPMVYDEASDRWQYQFEVTDQTSNGIWEISGIQAYDEVGNVDVVAPHIKAVTVYGAADSERPVIYIDTLSSSKDTATVGDDVIISIKVTDNESLARVVITFDNIDSGKMVIYQPMIYSPDDDVWRYTFSVSSNTPDGTWIVSNIQAYDEVGNVCIESPASEVFMVYGAADSKKPVIEAESLFVSANTATFDDHVLISIVVTDNVAVSRVVISLDNRDTGKMVIYQPMSKKLGSDVWEYDFYIAEDISDGVWELSNIQAYDEAGNGAIIAPHSTILTTNHVFDFTSASGLKLPHNVTVIEEEAFYGCDETIVVIPSTCKTIRARCFAYSKALHRIWIPASVTSISLDAFDGSDNVIIYGERDSFAEQYADDNHIPFVLNE